MPFERDPVKNAKNLEQHAISFEDATRLWNKPHVIIPTKQVIGEDRFLILGHLNGKTHACVFTKRDENVRLISCHRADRKLERIFYAYFEKK